MRRASHPSQGVTGMMGKTMRFALIALAIGFTATAGLGQGRADGVIGLTDGEMDQLTAEVPQQPSCRDGDLPWVAKPAPPPALSSTACKEWAASANGLNLDGSGPSTAGISTEYVLIHGVQGKIASTATGTGGATTTSDGSIGATLALGPEQADASGTTTVSAEGQKAVTVVKTDISVPGVQIGARTTNEAEPSEDGVTLVSTTAFLITIDRSATMNADQIAGAGTGGDVSGVTPASGGASLSGGGTPSVGGSVLPSAATQRWGGDWAGPAVCLSCR
jgi:hypothetical protein